MAQVLGGIVGAGVEVVMAFMFLIAILGTTQAASAGFAGLAIGLALTLIHLISIPVTNTSVNPARSTAAHASMERKQLDHVKQRQREIW